MSILITSPCPESIFEELAIKNWPIWTCEASSFEWTYDDKETCFLLEGEVTVTHEKRQTIKFCAGYLVTFPAGMNCRWNVHQAVKKFYLFGN